MRQRARSAGVIPRDLVDVRERRAIVRAVRGTPVGRDRFEVREPIEVGSTDRDIVRRGGEATHGDSVSGPRTCGVLVTGRYEDRNAFRHGLLVSGVVRRVCRGSVFCLGFAVADADHRRQTGCRSVQHVLKRDEAAESRGRIGASGENDRRIGCRGAGPLDVDSGLAIVAVTRIAGNALEPRVRARYSARGADLTEACGGIRPRQTKALSERRPVGRRVKIGVFDHHDRLTLAADARLECRSEVIDGGEVGRHKRVQPAPGVIAGARWHQLRFGMEIMQGDDPVDRGRQRGGNPRFAHVGEVADPVHFQTVNLGVEGRTNRSGSAAEVDRQASGLNAMDGESLRL